MRIAALPRAGPARNIALYPLFKFVQSLLFWQAVWFLYFQEMLSGAAAILLYAIFDLATTALEVPSGYLSDRVGRRVTLLISTAASLLGAVLLLGGQGFWVFALAQVFLGAGSAFASGTDSALLYESLEEDGREAEVEGQELRAWRAGFAGFALSSVTGGFLGQAALTLPFAAGVASAALALILAWQLVDAPRTSAAPRTQSARKDTLVAALRAPVLSWLFALSVLMYGFSHLPYIFGQPFILDALAGLGLGGVAPAVSGTITALMMAVSLLASLVAPGLRKSLGLAPLLLLAFGLQVGLVALLSLSNNVIVIGFLVLRMVPDAFSKAFILARIQPELHDTTRATYLSLQSLAGRLIFAASLWLAAGSAPRASALAYPQIQSILGVYTLIGAASLAALALIATRLPIERR